MGIFLVNDSQTPPPFKNDNLGLLQIRILHLRKRREKSFSTDKIYPGLKFYRSKGVDYWVVTKRRNKGTREKRKGTFLRIRFLIEGILVLGMDLAWWI